MKLDELTNRGYVFDRHAECADCGDRIEWWRTPSKGWMAFNPMSKGSEEAVTHRRTCTEYNK